METERNLNHEKRIKAYLFNGGFDRFYNVCENIGVIANINALNNKLKEDKEVLK